jgi:DNA-binding CsgD family transcriptional regulator
MRILFVHQNFPGQYAHLLAHYASDPANEIVFLTRRANAPFAGIERLGPPSGPLSAREAEILRWLRQGKSAGEVAQILGRSEHTVKNQMRNLYEKLGVNNRVQALQQASRMALPE